MDSPHVMVNLTRDMIREKGPCSDGLEIFEREFPDGLVGRWDLTAQLLLLSSPVGRYFGWAVHVGLLPMWSMSGSDLSGSDLSGSDLSGSNLSGSDLRGSNLRVSNLSGSNLSGSDLIGSNLSGSDLSGSNLSGSNLRGSDGIHLADLTGAYRLISDHDIPGWRVVHGRLVRA